MTSQRLVLLRLRLYWREAFTDRRIFRTNVALNSGFFGVNELIRQIYDSQSPGIQWTQVGEFTFFLIN